MAKTNSIKICEATVISKTLSGSDFIVSLQEDKGKVHTLYLVKEESSKIDLGEIIQIILEKVE